MDLLAAAAREIEEWKHLQRKQFSEELAKVRERFLFGIAVKETKLRLRRTFNLTFSMYLLARKCRRRIEMLYYYAPVSRIWEWIFPAACTSFVVGFSVGQIRMRNNISGLWIRFTFEADPDQALYFNADPDPASHFNSYPETAPFQCDGSLRPDLYCERPRPSTALFSAVFRIRIH